MSHTTEFPVTASQHWHALRDDLLRYGGWGALLKEQSLWAVAWFRLGGMLGRLPGPIRRPVLTLWWLCFRFIEMLTGVSLPLGLQAKGGLRVWHFGNVFVNSQARLGRNCTLRQGVTIGNRHTNGPSPYIGDDVELGAYAQVLGDIRIGDRARVGAMSVVLHDIPDGATAVGAPARILMHLTAPTTET